MSDSEEISASIKALTDISIKKKRALTQILTICENQQTLLAAAPSEEQAEFLVGLSLEKQSLIECVIECDDVFAVMYKKAANGIESAAMAHMDKIKALQEEIKAVTRLDAKIRAAEEATRVYTHSIVRSAAKNDEAKRANATLPMDKLAEMYRSHGRK